MLFAAGCTVQVRAQGRHPSYSHALTDLRVARAHLARPTGSALTNWDESVAIREIDAAINDISQAAYDDGKNPGAQEPVDVGLDWSGRMHRAVELLARARHDAGGEEDNGAAIGARDRGLHHIDVAIGLVQQGINANHGPVAVAPPPPTFGQHPAYIHALEDLRAARANIERPAGVTLRTGWDESIAIREIDAAIHAIKEASIDDGKDYNAHPPIDAAMGWGGRLHHAADFLKKARNDCMHEEDNAFARGLQHRAIQHIESALGAVEDGIHSNHW
jgi:hypothetical protein